MGQFPGDQHDPLRLAMDTGTTLDICQNMGRVFAEKFTLKMHESAEKRYSDKQRKLVSYAAALRSV